MSENSEVKVLGRNVTQMPCFRETFMYSIGSGLSAGFVFFMLTSRVQRAVQVAIGTYTCVTLGYWSYCRYNFSNQKFRMAQLQVAGQKQAVYDGTEMEKKLKKEE